ncbi:MAG: hypothetical protein FJ264_13615 [Planctomycetes bacterium]|nr:hypothetical protein [Planctomycetota bacterium]
MVGNNSNHEPIIPSGEEAIKEFFDKLASIPKVNPTIAEVLKKLHNDDNLSKQTIIDALKSLREGES